MLIRLNHTCNHPQATGVSGDVLEVGDDVGRYLLDRRGATRVDAPQPPATAAESDEISDTDRNRKSAERTNQPDQVEPPAEKLSARERRRRAKQQKADHADAPETTADTAERSDDDDTETQDGDDTDAD